MMRLILTAFLFFFTTLQAMYVGPVEKYDLDDWPNECERIKQRLQSTKEESAAREKFGKQLANKYDMFFLGNADQYLFKETNKVIIGLNFISDRKLSLEEGRKFIKSIIEEYWKELKINPIYQKKLDLMVTRLPDAKVLNPHKLGIQIAFWDEEMNRPQYPHLACVQVCFEQIHYYFADPKTQAWQEPIIENLDQAVDLNP